MVGNKEIINVKKSNVEADYPVGQKLLINDINCVVTKRGIAQTAFYVFQTFIAMTTR